MFEGNKNGISLAKIFFSDKEIIPFSRHNASWRAQIGTHDIT